MTRVMVSKTSSASIWVALRAMGNYPYSTPRRKHHPTDLGRHKSERRSGVKSKRDREEAAVAWYLRCRLLFLIIWAKERNALQALKMSHIPPKMLTPRIFRPKQDRNISDHAHEAESGYQRRISYTS